MCDILCFEGLNSLFQVRLFKKYSYFALIVYRLTVLLLYIFFWQLRSIQLVFYMCHISSLLKTVFWFPRYQEYGVKMAMKFHEFWYPNQDLAGRLNIMTSNILCFPVSSFARNPAFTLFLVLFIDCYLILLNCSVYWRLIFLPAC